MSQPLQDVLKGKYEILEKIGEGGIGAVYKVRHRLLEEVRVIKVLRPEAASKEEMRERFLHEARMAIRLKHPNIAQLHDFSIAEDGRAYIVMEYIDGVSLDALIEASGPPSVDLAMEISRQALAALHFLHENDFVHRDVSPDNLMLASRFDGRPLVKLIDLGIARHLGAEVRLTATGVFLGKARYCSPEQFSAGGDTPAEVDRRADIYSFGVMLYELLTGVYPLRGDNFAELAGSHLFQPPRDFSETDPEGRLPDGLRAAVLRAMAKAPEDRFATAAELARELDRYRDPNRSLRDEFDRTVEIATTSLSKVVRRGRPGSTQDRLNAQFGMDTTPSPTLDTVAATRRRPLAEQVREIEGLIARGRRGRALRALDRALADHGAAAQLLELQGTIDRLGWGRRRWPTLVALAAAVVVAGGLAAWWWLGRPPGGEDAGAARPEASELIGSVTPRWGQAAVEAEPGPFSAAVSEPPPLPQEGAAGEDSTPVPAAGPSPGPPSEPSPADPQGEPPAEGEGPPPDEAPGAQPAEPPPPPGPEVTQEIFELGVGVVPPVLLELPTPALPDDSRKLRDELTVVVRVLVDETGGVSAAEIASGPTFRRNYREAALEAAEKARFRPAQRGNNIGRMWTEVRVVFRPE
jgi:TonB family protein